jgi:hypothetical protein
MVIPAASGDSRDHPASTATITTTISSGRSSYFAVLAVGVVPSLVLSD